MRERTSSFFAARKSRGVYLFNLKFQRCPLKHNDINNFKCQQCRPNRIELLDVSRRRHLLNGNVWAMASKKKCKFCSWTGGNRARNNWLITTGDFFAEHFVIQCAFSARSAERSTNTLASCLLFQQHVDWKSSKSPFFGLAMDYCN